MVWAWLVATALAAPGHVGMSASSTYKGGSVGLRLDGDPGPKRVRVGGELSVRTNAYSGKATAWARDWEDGDMFVQPLLGVSIDAGVWRSTYVSGGVALDALAPARAYRTTEDTWFPAWFDAVVVFPTSLGVNLLVMSQIKLTAGVAPTESLFVEAGVWPTSALVLLPVSNSGGTAAEFVEAMRPGVQVGVRFN